MRCPTCGFENQPGMRFCGSCGVPLQAAAPPSEERRLVTILFADVTGSTALGEALDPEDVRALYARYYAIARDVVAVHGGTVAKFIGDAVMAVFGLPQAHGDDAARALSAALELRDRVRTDSRLGERFPIRLGVNTGEVVATREAAPGDFIITGDAVNVAARLEQAADSWAILCGERSARASGGAFEFGPPADVAAKGKSAPIRAHVVLRRTGPKPARRVPLFGRTSDLAQLELIAKRVVAERRPFLVSLIAPAGTGKSRLLEEFLDRLPKIASGARVAVAQCLPYGQRLTYEPLRPVLHRLAGIDEDAPPESAREALRAWAHTQGLEAPDRTAELLAGTVGLGEIEAPDRAALFAAWRAAIEAVARRSALLVVFEDLHWSSDSLLDLVEYVVQPRGDTAVLMMALARPELLDRRPAWGGGRRNYVSLALEPLDEGAVTELVDHLLGRRSPEIVSRVVARSEGNPFYAGEIVRSVLDRLASLDDAGAVERALATLPDTVQATVLARLDLLDGRERRLLQLGSVFGRAFRPAGLAALEPDFSADVGPVWERLVEKDLIRSANGDGFTFRHILIREVAYGTLPRAERWRLHAAAGRWLEGSAPGREDALSELIAYHYHEAAGLAAAVEVEPAEAERIRAGAVRWLTRAADVAGGAAANSEAARHLRAAIELGEPGDLPDLYERLAHVTSGDSSVEAHTTALRLCREAGRPADQELRVLAGLLMMYTRFQGSVGARPSEDQIARLRAEGRELLMRAADERATAAFLIAQAFLPFWHSGGDVTPTPAELDEAESSGRRGLELAERLDDARLRSAALDALSSASQVRGDWGEVRTIARRRLAFEERLDLAERLDAYCMVTWASALLGDLSEAERVSRAGLTLVQPGQALAWTLHLLTWRLYALALLGRWDEVAAAGERACQLWRESAVMAAFAGRGFIAALDVARARGDRVRADEFLQVLRDIVRRAPPNSTMSKVGPYLDADPEGTVAAIPAVLRSHNPEYAERALALCADLGRSPAPETIRSALDFAATHRLRVLEAQARRALGLALRDSAELGRALEALEEVEAIPYAARVRCERALLTGDEEELAAGRRVLEELGDVEQLDRYVRLRRGALGSA